MRRIDELMPALLQPARNIFNRIGTRAETDVMHVPLGRFNENNLILIAPRTAHDHALALLVRFHAEIGVELPALGGVGHGKGDVLEGADGHGCVGDSWAGL